MGSCLSKASPAGPEPVPISYTHTSTGTPPEDRRHVTVSQLDMPRKEVPEAGVSGSGTAVDAAATQQQPPVDVGSVAATLDAARVDPANPTMVRISMRAAPLSGSQRQNHSHNHRIWVPQTMAYGVFDRAFDSDSHVWTCS